MRNTTRKHGLRIKLASEMQLWKIKLRGTRVLGVVMLLASQSVSVLNAQHAQSPRYTLVIIAPHPEVKAGSNLNVAIVLTNLSDKQLLVYTSGLGERDYTIRVLDKDGQEPLETRYLRAIRGKDTSDAVSKTTLVVVGGGGFHDVRPGGMFQLTTDLSQLYVLKPGKYTVRAERLDDETKATVKSNAITVTVNP